jgi:glycosyltransferase involved in cell wall biosynthesis
MRESRLRRTALSTTNVRVLHVSAYYAPAFVYGGPPRSIHALCRALPGQGMTVQVFTTDANGSTSLPSVVTNAGAFEDVPVTYFPRSWPQWPIGSRALTRALARDVAAYDAVHIHGLWNRAVWAAASEARRAGVPYVLSPRGMLEPGALAHGSWRKRAAYALIEHEVLAGASLLHATSETERVTLRELRPRVPVVLIPNGIDAPTAESAARPTPPPNVLFVGRLHPIKRPDLLIDAFAALRRRHPAARLIVAGPDERRMRAQLVARAGEHAGAIRWVGEVNASERTALLRDAAALVMCSDSESFGLAVLEAMAAAVPVVVTRTCPWPDVHRHGSGFWVDQRVDAVADALDRVLSDVDAAREMGRRGRALAESRYRWDVIASMFATQYRALAPARVSAAALHAAL